MIIQFDGSKQYSNPHTYLCFCKNIHKYGEMLVSWLGGTKVLAYWVALGGKTQDKGCIRAKGHA